MKTFQLDGKQKEMYYFHNNVTGHICLDGVMLNAVHNTLVTLIITLYSSSYSFQDYENVYWPLI